MQKKSEKYFKDYLSSIPNNQLIQFYEDLEWTPFPVLVLNEYQNRFKAKNKKEVLQKLRKQTKIAKRRGSEVKNKIKVKSKKLGKYISEAKLNSSEKHLEILEKLDDLNKKGIITNKEFQDKKKEILKRI